MDTINAIFGYYDKLIAGFSPAEQTIISLVLLIVLVWQIYMIFKSGHWIFIATLIILAPGTWPAAKNIGMLIWSVIKFLLVKVGVQIG